MRTNGGHIPDKHSLGHALHFDTDKATIDTGEEVHHPILSSVLHLTGDATTSGPTIVLDQTPHSKSCAHVCWRSVPHAKYIPSISRGLVARGIAVSGK